MTPNDSSDFISGQENLELFYNFLYSSREGDKNSVRVCTFLYFIQCIKKYMNAHTLTEIFFFQIEHTVPDSVFAVVPVNFHILSKSI